MAGRGRRLVFGLAIAAVVCVGVAVAVWSIVDDDAPEASATAAGPPRFVEETATAGVEQVYDGEFTFFVGGGVAALDCDDDGRPDLYIAGGTNPAGLYRNESPVGGALRFSRVSDPVTDTTDVVGAYPVDIDSDGHLDLVVLRVGENQVLRGLGDCRFEPADAAWSIAGGAEWTAGFSATWEGAAALPTLGFGNYLDLDSDGRPTGECADSALLRPDDGRYGQPIRLAPGWCTLSVLFSDWNRTGRTDLRMTNDRHYYRDGEEQLWRIEADEAPALYSEDEGWMPMQIWGMGIAAQDVTGDGLPEVFLTSQGDNKLQTLESGVATPTYTDIAIRRGVTAHRPFAGEEVLPSTAWHPEFQDVNNDGYIDLYISKGNVDSMVEYAADDPSNLLLGQPDGTFVESALEAGVVSLGRSRGGAVVDLNLDGLVDLVEVNRRENVRLWRNAGSGTGDEPAQLGSWVALQLDQSGVNVDAIGSWVEVRIGDRVVERQLTVGGGHASGQLGWIHFGLGDVDSAEIRVIWPDGEVGPWLSVEADSHVIVERGADEVTSWDPPS